MSGLVLDRPAVRTSVGEIGPVTARVTGRPPVTAQPSPIVRLAAPMVFLLEPVGPTDPGFGRRLAQQLGCTHVDAKVLLRELRMRPIPRHIVIDVVQASLQKHTGPVILTGCPRDCEEALHLEGLCAVQPIVMAIRHSIWREAEAAIDAATEKPVTPAKMAEYNQAHDAQGGICRYFQTHGRLHFIAANQSIELIEQRALECLTGLLPHSTRNI